MARHGRNRLTPQKAIPSWKLFARQILNIINVLILASGVLGLISWCLDTDQMVNLYVAIILFVVVLMMCSASFYEEKKAMQVIKGFANLLPQKCTIRREGKDRQTDAEQLVVGDLVWIRNGDKVS